MTIQYTLGPWINDHETVRERVSYRGIATILNPDTDMDVDGIDSPWTTEAVANARLIAAAPALLAALDRAYKESAETDCLVYGADYDCESALRAKRVTRLCWVCEARAALRLAEEGE